MKRLALLLIIAMGLIAPLHARDQKTQDVWYGEHNNEMHHVAWYLGGYVDTLMTGPEKGLQKIYIALGGDVRDEVLLDSSQVVVWTHDNDFVHYYKTFKVYSTPTEQWIRRK